MSSSEAASAWDTVTIETEGLKALLTKTTLTIHDSQGGRVIVSGPAFELLTNLIKARG